MQLYRVSASNAVIGQTCWRSILATSQAEAEAAAIQACQTAYGGSLDDWQVTVVNCQVVRS